MPAPKLVVRHEFPAAILDGFERLRAELEIPTEFPAEVLAEADQVVAAGYDKSVPRVDHTDKPFVTIDPPDSMDLDQAMFIERAGEGFTVWYAIADVAAWVKPGGAIDIEANRRGQTYYAPHERAPLHPPQLSEDAASLLDDGVARPALVWRLDLDAKGEVTKAFVERGLVTSRAKLNYEEEQSKMDAGTADPTMLLLKEVGELREQVEVERGGVSLNLPEQEVHINDGEWNLAFRIALPNEGWNAQISLMTGFAAAKMMLDAGVGILRTLPPPDERTIKTLRKVAHSLKIDWRKDESYAEFVRNLDPTEPAHQAMMMSCIRLFRGAGYTLIGEDKAAEELVHGALAANYAHTTAPLRRLVDRYVGEICVAICAGEQVPQWVLDALHALPDTMKESDRRAKAYERGINDLVEALVLQHRVGESFNGVVIQLDEKRPGQAVFSMVAPAVEANVKGRKLELGEEIQAKLTKVDLQQGLVSFEA